LSIAAYCPLILPVPACTHFTLRLRLYFIPQKAAKNTIKMASPLPTNAHLAHFIPFYAALCSN